MAAMRLGGVQALMAGVREVFLTSPRLRGEVEAEGFG
jgi:hypothetical protein